MPRERGVTGKTALMMRLPMLRFTDLAKDAVLVEAACAAADEFIKADPDAARAHVERWMGSRQDLTLA